MRKVELRGKWYQACDEWNDLTLEKFIELSQIEVPEKLERLWIASSMINTDIEKDRKAAEKEYKAANAAITEKDIVKVFPIYYGKVIQLLTEIPEEVVDLMHHATRVDMFDQLLRGFALSLVYSAPVIIMDGEAQIYEPPEMKTFKLKGEEYQFPKSLRLYGDLIPMADEEVAPFAEAADIDLAIRELRRDGVQRFPLFMAIYCRKEGEAYEEKIALQRAELFKQASMEVVWSLFFCIVQHTRTLHNYIRRSLMISQEQIDDQILAQAESTVSDGEE